MPPNRTHTPRTLSSGELVLTDTAPLGPSQCAAGRFISRLDIADARCCAPVESMRPLDDLGPSAGFLCWRLFRRTVRGKKISSAAVEGSFHIPRQIDQARSDIGLQSF